MNILTISIIINVGTFIRKKYSKIMFQITNYIIPVQPKES